jgi:hypothetical protein
MLEDHLREVAHAQTCCTPACRHQNLPTTSRQPPNSAPKSAPPARVSGPDICGGVRGSAEVVAGPRLGARGRLKIFSFSTLLLRRAGALFTDDAIDLRKSVSPVCSQVTQRSLAATAHANDQRLAHTDVEAKHGSLGHQNRRRPSWWQREAHTASETARCKRRRRAVARRDIKLPPSGCLRRVVAPPITRTNTAHLEAEHCIAIGPLRLSLDVKIPISC